MSHPYWKHVTWCWSGLDLLGLDVYPAGDASLPQEPAFRLAVIGRMLSEEDKEAIVEEVRRRWSGIRILFLTNQRDSLQEISSHEYTSSSLPPREFVENCRQLLEV